MSPFSVIVTPSSIAFTAINGKPFNITSAHPSFQQIKELVKRYQAEPENADAIRAQMDHFAEPASAITDAGQGRVVVRDGVILFNGEEIHNAITERIIWGMAEGYGMDSYIMFLDKLMDNPSKRAVDELYGFIEKHKMGIGNDGHIIAYKKVRENFHDIYTGKFDNSPGQVLDMPRNAVDDNSENTCSEGYHFCAFEYLGSFGCEPGSRVVIVKVNPRDVVSIPKDYNDAKARCCHYEVIGEYQGDDLQDVLGNRPVWSDDSLNEQFNWDDDEGEYEAENEDEDSDDSLNEQFDENEDEDSDVYFNGFFSYPVGPHLSVEEYDNNSEEAEEDVDDNGLIYRAAQDESNVLYVDTPNHDETSKKIIEIMMDQNVSLRVRRAGRHIIKVEFGGKISVLGGAIDITRIVWDDGKETFVTADQENDLNASLRDQAAAGHKARVIVQ